MNDKTTIDVKTLPVITKFIYTIGELPTSYMMSMTYEEQVVWLCNYLETKIIPALNQNGLAVEELQTLYELLRQYVNDYFDNLDVQEEINNKLDEMVEDGTIDNILAKVFIQNGKLLLNLVHRDCSSFVTGITDESSEDSVKGYIQGMTTTPTSIIYAVNPGGTEHMDKSNYSWLIEVSKSTNEIIRERFLNIYHGNCLAYNDEEEEIYVACVSQVNEAGTGQEAINKILVLDYRTLETKETITPPEEVLATGDHIMSVSYDNDNKILGIGGLRYFWILSDWETIEKTITISYDKTAPLVNKLNNNRTTNQMIILKGNRLYQCRYFTNGIVIRDLDGNVINSYYDFKTNVPIPINEFESIAIEEDGTLYLATCQRAYTPNLSYGLYDNTIFKTNIKTGGYFENMQDSFNIYNPNFKISYHVDPLTTNKLQIGTYDHPFKHIQQALDSAVLYEGSLTIQCNSSANYEFMILNNNKNLTIYGSNNATFYGMQAIHQNITIIESTFDLSHNLPLDSNYNNIYLEYCDVEFNNTTFIGGDNINYALTGFHTNLGLNYCSFSNFVNALYMRNLCESTIVGTTFGNADYYFLLDGYNTINYSTEYVYSRCNPDGVLPNVVSVPQMLQYTKTDNHFVFNHGDIVSHLKTTSLLNMALGININSTSHVSSITFRYASGYYNVIFTQDGKFYTCYFYISTTQTGFNIDYLVFETTASGVTTNVTSSTTIDFYSVMEVE